MSTPILYDYWRSSAAYRVRIALGLKGVAYEARSVDLRAGEQRSAENLARNPQGLVPVLDIDGLQLTQSLAILDYLDETRPEPLLTPVGAAARARVRALAHAVTIEIHPVLNLRIATRVAALAGIEMKDWMHEVMPSGLAAVEEMLGDGQMGAFCHGDAPGLADCCLIPQLYNAHRWEVDLAPFPRIRAIEAECGALDAFQRAHPDAVRPA